MRDYTSHSSTELTGEFHLVSFSDIMFKWAFTKFDWILLSWEDFLLELTMRCFLVQFFTEGWSFHSLSEVKWAGLRVGKLLPVCSPDKKEKSLSATVLLLRFLRWMEAASSRTINNRNRIKWRRLNEWRIPLKLLSVERVSFDLSPFFSTNTKITLQPFLLLIDRVPTMNSCKGLFWVSFCFFFKCFILFGNTIREPVKRREIAVVDSFLKIAEKTDNL